MRSGDDVFIMCSVEVIDLLRARIADERQPGRCQRQSKPRPCVSFEIGLKHMLVARLRRVKGRTEFAATDRDDFGRCEFEQTFRAARDAEAAASASAERQARVGCRNNQIVDA